MPKMNFLAEPEPTIEPDRKASRQPEPNQPQILPQVPEKLREVQSEPKANIIKVT